MIHLYELNSCICYPLHLDPNQILVCFFQTMQTRPRVTLSTDLSSCPRKATILILQSSTFFVPSFDGFVGMKKLGMMVCLLLVVSPDPPPLRSVHTRKRYLETFLLLSPVSRFSTIPAIRCMKKMDHTLEASLPLFAHLRVDRAERAFC